MPQGKGAGRALAPLGSWPTIGFKAFVAIGGNDYACGGGIRLKSLDPACRDRRGDSNRPSSEFRRHRKSHRGGGLGPLGHDEAGCLGSTAP
jgi:hypothetical protein